MLSRLLVLHLKQRSTKTECINSNGLDFSFKALRSTILSKLFGITANKKTVCSFREIVGGQGGSKTKDREQVCGTLTATLMKEKHRRAQVSAYINWC